MSTQWINRLLDWYRSIISSIGFLPTLIALAFGLLAVLLQILNTNGITTFLLENAPGFLVRDGDTARIILSTIVGGLVSLVVFSFTMVMSQLNRAAAQYSPRLLPGLISSKRHQIVLGFFLGTIVFALLVLIEIKPSQNSYELPGLAILICIVAALSCLAVFVYFIHSISLAIQVNVMLKTVAGDTVVHLEKLHDRETRHQKQLESVSDFAVEPISSGATGYFRECNEAKLLELATKHETVITVGVIPGEFVLENTTVVWVDHKIESELADEIVSCARFDGNLQVSENYLQGCKQITEIAVRAMSPGTNDPGTALTAIDHLTLILAKRMQLDDQEVLRDESDEIRVVLKVVPFSELLYYLIAPLRLYCKHDVVIVLKILQMLDQLLHQPDCESGCYHDAIREEMKSLLEEAEESIESPRDRDRLKAFAGSDS